MRQGLLPLETGPVPTTFTELRERQAKLYQEQGPGLIRRTLSNLNALVEDPDDLGALICVNDLALQLGALNADWFEFSVAVFCHLLAFNINTPVVLKDTFIETLTRLADHAEPAS
jgi:hypothetical protein